MVDAKTGLVPGVGALPEAFDAACTMQWVRAQRAPWTESDAPLIAAWLRANEAASSDIEAAASGPRFRIPLPGLSMATAPPSMLLYRQAVQALRVTALLALARGDVKSAQRTARPRHRPPPCGTGGSGRPALSLISRLVPSRCAVSEKVTRATGRKTGVRVPAIYCDFFREMGRGTDVA